MKIALLNLQYDNNYGGNIQRYALMTVLQRLGHDVTHMNLRFNFNHLTTKEKVKKNIKKIVYKYILRKPFVDSPQENFQRKYVQSCEVMDRFYNKYIQHTNIIGSKNELKKNIDYDLFIVGSDQVWRKSIASFYGIETYFFDYLPDNMKRIAYGVSLGISENELDIEDINNLTPLYQKFAAVSVREDSALQLFKQYGWNKPLAEQVLDPTLLLTQNDYLELINGGFTVRPNGNMFCYILDPSPEKNNIIKNYEKEKGLNSFVVGLSTEKQMSMQQWLRSFSESKFVITDSYHGVVFSIIFNKQFKLINNAFRGNARFESLFRLLDISAQEDTIDYSRVNARINKLRIKSIDFLRHSVV